MDKQIILNKDWFVQVTEADMNCQEITMAKQLPDEWITAEVPGDWPLDLVRAGKLEEPYWRNQYLKLVQMENKHVFYCCEFDWSQETDCVFLRFEGIDTISDIYLNGKKIQHTENMYIVHEFKAAGLVRGKNELLVHLLPTAVEARRNEIGAFCSAQKYNYESLVVRKAAHMFGWDICPRIVGGGLWRPVSLILYHKDRIRDSYIWVKKIHSDGKISCCCAFDTEIAEGAINDYTIRLEGTCGGSHFELEQRLWFTHGVLSFDVEKAHLWWPVGYGSPNLYKVRVQLSKNGFLVDEKSFEQGLRTVKLNRDDYLVDGKGDFCFIVNEKRIFIKGTNWVPADAFHGQDMKRIPRILELVKDIGCNAIRIWGGGVYENDFLYDWCDKNGIMIWQDFMMACALYPQNDSMQAKLAEEAKSEVKRLRRHASICLWAGDNECDEFRVGITNPENNILTRKVLPSVLMEEDLSRPYLPSSPYISGDAYRNSKVDRITERHLWGPRDYFKGKYYHDADPIFVSEMGYHGCNSPESLYRFIGKENSWPVDNNPDYLFHATSPELISDAPYNYRIRLMSEQLRFLFKHEPHNLNEYAIMSQISQAEAKKYFIEKFRSHRDYHTGVIWWNIMDCWPQISDAVVDYYYCRKLAYFYIRRSQQSVCLMADDHSGKLVLYGVNDELTDRKIQWRVVDIDTDKIILSGNTVLRAEESTPLTDITLPNKKCKFLKLIWNENNMEEDHTNHYLFGEPPYDYEWYMKCLRRAGYDEFEGFSER